MSASRPSVETECCTVTERVLFASDRSGEEFAARSGDRDSQYDHEIHIPLADGSEGVELTRRKRWHDLSSLWVPREPIEDRADLSR